MWIRRSPISFISDHHVPRQTVSLRADEHLMFLKENSGGFACWVYVYFTLLKLLSIDTGFSLCQYSMQIGSWKVCRVAVNLQLSDVWFHLVIMRLWAESALKTLLVNSCPCDNILKLDATIFTMFVFAHVLFSGFHFHMAHRSRCSWRKCFFFSLISYLLKFVWIHRTFSKHNDCICIAMWW